MRTLQTVHIEPPTLVTLCKHTHKHQLRESLKQSHSKIADHTSLANEPLNAQADSPEQRSSIFVLCLPGNDQRTAYQGPIYEGGKPT